MITLYTFGPYFGLPDGSPFVMKAELLLKIAGLDYEVDRRGYSRAPKGKLPYVRDDGEVIADSTFIRFHLERKYGIDFDRGLTPAQRATAWAVEKMCEEHLYWGLIATRWFDEANFRRGPAQFFNAIPAPVRPLVRGAIRRGLRKTARGQGLGRHTPAELDELMRRDLSALAVLLGEQPYLTGNEPRGVDATVGAFVIGCLCPVFESPLRSAANSSPALVDYGRRMLSRYYPDYAAT